MTPNLQLLTKQALKAIEDGIPQEELFTPILDGVRTVMRVKVERKEKLKRRGPGLWGAVTDDLTGKRYQVYGAECGVPGCWCDARVETREEKEDSSVDWVEWLWIAVENGKAAGRFTDEDPQVEYKTRMDLMCKAVEALGKGMLELMKAHGGR